jgi:DNA-binding IclR family transcriptional regulator
MLSLLSDAEVSELYPAKLPALTAATLSTRAALLTLLAKARAAGFATESEESTPGVRCIGVAGRTGRVTYGLSITVPVQRATADQLQDFLPALHDTITRLHGALSASEWLAPGSLAQAGPEVQQG